MINGRHACDEHWNHEDAMVDCRMLRYASVEENFWSEFGYVVNNNFIMSYFLQNI